MEAKLTGPPGGEGVEGVTISPGLAEPSEVVPNVLVPPGSVLAGTLGLEAVPAGGGTLFSGACAIAVAFNIKSKGSTGVLIGDLHGVSPRIHR